jgi:hypothetical protein
LSVVFYNGGSIVTLYEQFLEAVEVLAKKPNVQAQAVTDARDAFRRGDLSETELNHIIVSAREFWVSTARRA